MGRGRGPKNIEFHPLSPVLSAIMCVILSHVGVNIMLHHQEALTQEGKRLDIQRKSTFCVFNKVKHLLTD